MNGPMVHPAINLRRQAWASVTRPLKCQTPGDLKYGSDSHIPPLISACAAKEQILFIYGDNSLFIKENPPNFGNMWGWVIFGIF